MSAALDLAKRLTALTVLVGLAACGDDGDPARGEATVIGRVVAPDSAPAPAALILQGETYEERAQLSGDGAFVMQGIPPGSYLVEVEFGDGDLVGGARGSVDVDGDDRVLNVVVDDDLSGLRAVAKAESDDPRVPNGASALTVLEAFADEDIPSDDSTVTVQVLDDSDVVFQDLIGDGDAAVAVAFLAPGTYDIVVETTPAADTATQRCRRAIVLAEVPLLVQAISEAGGCRIFDNSEGN